jgi:cytochrome oxidase assembly protein ShyY1
LKLEKKRPILRIRKLLQGIAVLLIAVVFTLLGLWQLDRASDLKRSQEAAKIVDPKIYSLSELVVPSTALDSRGVGKSVATSGFYVANFKAPGQIDAKGDVADWEVALLQVDSDSINSTPTLEPAGILIVRGLWSQRLKNPEIAQSTRIEIVGIMQPHQFDDLTDNSPGVISRLDSSVIVGLTDLALYDGFIVAKSEKTRDGFLERTRLTPPKLNSKVGGFYWQHISYVVVWWLMALVVLYLPFYRRTINHVDGPKDRENGIRVPL